MNQTGLLPSLIYNGTRWWLPLSTRSATSLAQAWLSGRSHVDVSLLQRDPVLLAWIRLESLGPTYVAIEQLALDLLPRLGAAFHSGERLLGAPADLSPFQSRWLELSQEPLSDASLEKWLRVTGPEIPSDWRNAWPAFVGWEPSTPDANVGTLDYGYNALDMSLLLCRTKRLASLADGFDAVLQTEKLAAIKELAYGLSHEINNPLANISTRASSLLRDETSADRRRMLDAICAQSMRAFEMIADMMFYAHPPKPTREGIDVSALILEIINEHQPTLDSQGISITSHLPPKITGCIDPNKIADAVRALLRNAIEAVASPGRIDIRLRTLGDEIELRISDNGSGLNRREQRHAFDPFFSGREAGRGLGLGLCKTKRIAELHGGTIHLRSGPVGTTAILSLPAMNACPAVD